MEAKKLLALRVIKDSFVQLYENLFKFIIINIIWFGILTIPAYILYFVPNNTVFILGIVYILIIGGPLLLSGLDNITKVLNRGDPGILGFFKGIKTNFKRGFLAFLFTILVYIILGLDILFFLQRSNSWLFLIIGVFTFYIFFIFTMMQIYYWGLLNRNKEEKIRTIIKKSFVLTVDNVIQNLLLLILMLIITILNVVIAIILPILFLSLISLIIITGTNYTLERYKEKSKNKDSNQQQVAKQLLEGENTKADKEEEDQ